jgi:hypothetical protein
MVEQERGLEQGAAPRKTARCVGCHVGHSMLQVPAEPAWTNPAPSAEVTASFESNSRRGVQRQGMLKAFDPL